MRLRYRGGCAVANDSHQSDGIVGVRRRTLFLDIVRHEARHVAGHHGVVLAHADAGGFVADDPRADDRVAAVEDRGREQRLADEALGAIAFVDHRGRDAVADDRDIGALAREDRLAGIAGAERGGGGVVVEEGGQQVGMPRVARPEQRQQALVGEDRLPCGFDPAHPRGDEVGGIGFAQHRFPRVELERRLQFVAVGVDEPTRGVEADVAHLDEFGLDPRLGREVFEEADGLAVLDRLRVGGEMDEAAGRKDRREPRAELVEQAVELVRTRGQRAVRDRLFQPQPLEGRAFEHRSRGVRVVFVELGGAGAVIGEVEPAVERGLPGPPAVRNQRVVRLGNGQPVQDRLVANRLVDQREAHLVEVGGGRFEIVVDLAQREGIGRTLVPIGIAAGAVIDEADRLGLVAPVGARGHRDAAHAISRGAWCCRRAVRSAASAWAG